MTVNCRVMYFTCVGVCQNVRFIVSTQLDSETHRAVLMRHCQLLGSVDVRTLDVCDKSDVVRRRLAKFAKKLDESAFNNQVRERSLFSLAEVLVPVQSERNSVYHHSRNASK